MKAANRKICACDISKPKPTQSIKSHPAVAVKHLKTQQERKRLNSAMASKKMRANRENIESRRSRAWWGRVKDVWR